MRKLLSMIAVFLSATACIYPYEPQLDEAPEGLLTVDGNINIGATSTVQLGTLLSLWPSETRKAIDLQETRVWLEDDAGTTYPGELDQGSAASINYWGATGVFKISTENAPDDRRYRLCVETPDASYISDWNEIPAPPVIRDIQFAADDETVTVQVSVDGGAEGTGYLLLSYDETWEFHAEYVPHYKVDTRTWQISEDNYDYSRYWCWKSAANYQSFPVDYTGMKGKGVTNWPLFSFPRKNDRNHRRYCVNVYARTLSQSSYRFLKHLQDISEGGDDLFTPNPGEIPANIRCESEPDRMVYGYVLFSRAISKRGWLDSRYFTPYPVSSLVYLVEDRKVYESHYNRLFRPLEENPNTERDPQKEGPYGWGSQRCYDCTAAGGTQKRPSYWDESE